MNMSQKTITQEQEHENSPEVVVTTKTAISASKAAFTPALRPVLKRIAVVLIVLGMISCNAMADVSEETIADMPVREVTVFKDGHAFVLHEGLMPVNDRGNVVLDYLPCPITGTFWTHSADPTARLTSVVSGKRVVSIKKTALTAAELIEGNIGARVQIKENSNITYEATILDIPTRSSEELEHTSPPGTPESLPEQGNIVLLKVAEGVKAVPINQIREVIFLENPKADVNHEEFRNIMTLKLDWKKDPSQKARVGMSYIQRGIRWIPNYRVEMDGKGHAHIKLQATLVNELTDLVDVKTHLVIGVPTFAFKDTPDPISLQQTVAQLSSVFQQNSRTAYSFSNSIMSQKARMGEFPGNRNNDENIIDLGPEVTGSGRNEDMFIFTLDHVTLKKGQRMVVPVTEFTLEYSDIFVLNLPFAPPPEVRRNFNDRQQTELARLFRRPRVMHKIRLENDSEAPLTTAPALILRDQRVIAQGMMTYTAIGASSDLEVTTAVDISVDLLDKETGRIPNAQKWDGNSYNMNKLAGTINIKNHRPTNVEIEVTRSVLGHIDSVEPQGEITHLGGYETGSLTDGYPFWWQWHNWPYWWYHLNERGRIKWDFQLEPDEDIDLKYNWHYFWRR